MTKPLTLTHGRLTDDEADELTSLLVYGLEEPETVDGETLPAWEPLNVRQAARFMGVRVKRARASMTDPKLRKMLAEKIEAWRSGERVQNLRVAIAIRDNEGMGTAADRMAQLAAIKAIEGTAGGAQVNIAIQHNVNGASVAPGYVIRLPSRAMQATTSDEGSQPLPLTPALTHAPLIDVTPVRLTADVESIAESVAGEVAADMRREGEGKGRDGEV